MQKTEITAYAKVNFILNVLGQRPDGYHEVETVMQAVGLHDSVTVGYESAAGAPGTDIFLDPGRPDLPADGDNLAWRAAVKMHERFHADKRDLIRICVVKRIPVAAGLAGGSADCAAVINGLARLWNIPDEQALLAAGAELGADVPFCILAQRGVPAAIGTGTGTELRPVEPTRCRIVLTTPPVSVPTRSVYGELSPADCAERADTDAFLSALPLKEKTAVMSNHLQAPAERLFPEIGSVIDAHGSLYPASLHTQLSGSGPTVFSVYEPDCAVEIPESFSDFQTIVCNTVV